MATEWATAWKEKFIHPQIIQERVEEIRQGGKAIVTLNGSFDLLHAGHLHIIHTAKCQGDLLIVALNSDGSIRGYKGPDRPIIDLSNRLQMMAALGFVDYVTWFDEATPVQLLEKIRPDVHVNGAEYGQNCVEKEVVERYGGKIYIVDLIPGLSTSAILDKIRSLQEAPCV
ncbi:MAG: adenylyltransferase/cytidyltransferase family protein [Chlamydiia bacterium]|nr:adenylyltransferase/cytidyltransferase family protein [Chlamydiia bacterium]